MHSSRASFIRSMYEKASRPLPSPVRRKIERECKRYQATAGLNFDRRTDRVALYVEPQLGHCVFTGDSADHPVRPPSDVEAHSATFELHVRRFQIDMRGDVRAELAAQLRRIANDILAAAGRVNGSTSDAKARVGGAA